MKLPLHEVITNWAATVENDNVRPDAPILREWATEALRLSTVFSDVTTSLEAERESVSGLQGAVVEQTVRADEAEAARERQRELKMESHARASELRTELEDVEAECRALRAYAELLRVALSGARFGLMWIAHNEDKTLPEWAREIAKEKMEQADVALQRVKDSTQDGICAAHSPGSTTTRPDGGAISPEKTCQGEGRHPSPDFLHQSCTKPPTLPFEVVQLRETAKSFRASGDQGTAHLMERSADLLEMASAVAADAVRHQVCNVPEGWKLVPLVPTEEMLMVGLTAYQNAFGSPLTRVSHEWDAMLAAAPDSQFVACTKPGSASQEAGGVPQVPQPVSSDHEDGPHTTGSRDAEG